MDIRVDVSFKGHRKRKRLKSLIGPDATDYILDLWISTAQNHPDGKLNDMDALDIALEAGWDKDPETFVNALLECKLIDKNSDGFELHDWDEHQPWVVHAPERSAKAKHAAEKRWGKPKHATSMPQASGEETDSNAPSPNPSPNPSPCPHQKIVDVYHIKCPSLPKVQVISPTLQKTLRTRWREDPDRQDLKWWKWYFSGVNDSDYLTGKVKSWTASFDWLIGPKNMTKVLNGNYLNRDNEREEIEDWINE